MLINLSDDPSSTWTARQLENAKAAYVSIHDIPFPEVDPNLSEKQLDALVEAYAGRCRDLLPPGDEARSAILVMGELTFIVAFVSSMLQAGIPCVAATRRTFVENLPGGGQQVHHTFVKFREYRG